MIPAEPPRPIPPPPRHRNRANACREMTTAQVLAAVECLRWDAADLAANPDAWDSPAESLAFVRMLLEDYDAELRRREHLRHHPLAPAWPEGRGDLDEIKRRIDLVAYMERTTVISFHSVGAQLRTACPFPDHEAHSWGFVVHPEKQLWHCFGCLRGGDLFDFTQEWLGLDFPAAVALLAREAGVARPHRAAPVCPRRLRVREARHA